MPAPDAARTVSRDTEQPWGGRHVAIGAVSAAVIVLQIAVTRILSVLVWYHWAFFAISLAMLGMGAPGVWLAVGARRPKLENVLLAAGVLVPAGVAAMIRWHHVFGPLAILFCMACLLPALLSLGTAVCVLLLEAEGPAVSRMYGSDLLGACLGALAVVPLMNAVATPNLAAAAGLLPLVAHELCAPPRRRMVGRAAAVLVAALALWGAPFHIRYTKAQETGTLEPLLVKWTPTARIAIFPEIPWARQGFGWGIGSRPHKGPMPEQYWLDQDGSAGTPITRYDGDDQKLRHLFDDVTSVGYQLRAPRAVAIVGAGGGRDILTAHLAGAERIDAIELNPAIVAALRGPLGRFSGDVYGLPGVRAVVGEGRSTLTRVGGGYDLIQISMIDSWAATAAGAYALSENNLYTVEAYRLYLQRLSPRGIVSTSRWLSVGFGFEIPRLLLLTKAALAAEGITAPLDHLAVVQAGQVATVLLSRAPWSPDDLAALRRVAEARGFVVALPLPPGAGPDAPGANLAHLIDEDPRAVERFGFMLSPPSDDKPFFFQMVSPFNPPEPQLLAKLGFNAQAVGTLRTLMIAMALATLLLFFAPFVARRWLPRGPAFWNASGYFLSIGLAFMLLEIGWLQRCVLYLGHPSLAATAALGFMLLGAGTGSMLSRGLDPRDAERLGWLLAALCAAANFVQGPVMSGTLGWPLQARLLITGVLLVPPGAGMGLAFPLGMMAFGERHKAWLWALNGAASVLASVVSLALAMELGFSRVGYLGAALYLPAWLLFRTRSHPRPLRAALGPLCAVPLALAALFHITQLIRTIGARIHYPIDLEWMEGGQILAAWRLMHGKGIYDACRDGFIPFAYPPVHAALVAAAGAVFGLDYHIARGVSVVAFAGGCYYLTREVAGLGRGARGLAAAFVTLGFLAASYPMTGAWYDLVRVDSTCFGFLVLGAMLSLPGFEQSFRRRLSNRRVVAAAAAMVAAVFAKQTAALFVPWLLGFGLWRERRTGARLAFATGALAAAALGALQLSSHGHFWTLVFEVMRRHPLIPAQFRGVVARVLAFAPYLVLMPPLALWLGVRRKLPARTVFWLGMAASGLGASLYTGSKIGAFINNLMTVATFAPAAAMMLGLAWLDAAPVRRTRHALGAAAGSAFLGLVLFSQPFDDAEFIPDREHWQQAAALSHFVRDLPDGVLMPAHSFLPMRLGHGNLQMHEQGYVDVMGAGVETIDVSECIAHLDARWLIVNNMAEPHLQRLLAVAYAQKSELPAQAKPLVGKYTVPSLLFEHVPGDPWLLERPNRRELFDFESGSLAGWERTGNAFEPGVTVARLPYQQPIVAHRGHYLLNSFNPHSWDAATGTARSPEFDIDRARLGFRVGGGSSSRLRVELEVGGQVARSAAGAGRGGVEVLVPVVWDVAELGGRRARIVVTDAEPGEWGHVLADAFELFDAPP